MTLLLCFLSAGQSRGAEDDLEALRRLMGPLTAVKVETKTTLTEAKDGAPPNQNDRWTFTTGGELRLNFAVPDGGAGVYVRIELALAALAVNSFQTRLTCYPGGFGPAHGHPSHRWVVTAKGEAGVPNWTAPLRVKGGCHHNPKRKRGRITARASLAYASGYDRIARWRCPAKDFLPTADNPFPVLPLPAGDGWAFYADQLQSRGWCCCRKNRPPARCG